MRNTAPFPIRTCYHANGRALFVHQAIGAAACTHQPVVPRLVFALAHSALKLACVEKLENNRHELAFKDVVASHGSALRTFFFFFVKRTTGHVTRLTMVEARVRRYDVIWLVCACVLQCCMANAIIRRTSVHVLIRRIGPRCVPIRWKKINATGMGIRRIPEHRETKRRVMLSSCSPRRD